MVQQRTPMELLPEVHKIAVLRANALGDYCFGLPALEALRAAYPRAEIVLLAAGWIAAFAETRPGPVDRAVGVPVVRGVGAPPDAAEDPAAIEAFCAAMAAEGFDLAIQMHGGGRYSNPFLLRLGARHTAGFRAPDAPPLDRTIPYLFYQREVLRNLELVGLVGARPVTLEPRVAVTPADLSEAGIVAPPDERPLVAVHPGVGDPRRQWPAEKFAAVARALAAAGARVLLTGTVQELALCAEVARLARGAAEDVSGRLSLGGLAGLLSRCRVVVANDTGPLHVAAAVGAATVGIFWCGNMIIAGPMTQARRRAAVSWRLDCPVCGVDCTRGRCEHRESFVADVPADEVLGHALELLAA
jgi:ADP-heptose:LPS heptosyltransferase